MSDRRGVRSGLWGSRSPGRLLVEPLETRLLLSASLPQQVLFMSGYHDGANPHFSEEVLPHFNVIAGTTNNLAFVNSLSAQGKLFSHHVHNDPNATTWQQLVNIWSEPFTRGIDAVHIDELHPWANGTADSNRVVTAELSVH